MDTHTDTAANSAPTFSGDRLRAFRVVGGFSRAELATNAQISTASVIAYEQGRFVPSSTVLGRLAMALGCGVGALFTTGDEISEYWSAVEEALPPLTTAEARDLGGVLYRIDARRATERAQRDGNGT